MQFEALPEDEKYSGTDSVEELLNKMKKGGAVKCVGNGICENICPIYLIMRETEKSNYIKTILCRNRKNSK